MVTTPASTAKSVVEEHRRLRKFLGSLANTLACLPRPELRRHWVEDLSRQLGALRPLLAAHFAYEEEAGLFEEISEASPADEPACRRLRDEHRGLLAALDGALEGASEAPADEARFESFLGDVREFARELARHEQSENDLVFRALDGGPSPLD
jgi:hypothetical protein